MARGPHVLLAGRVFRQVDVLDEDGQPNVLMLQRGAANGDVAAAAVTDISLAMRS